MAKGESQTLLIWTIIFLVLLLIMIIFTVVIRGWWTEAASLLADVTSKNNQLTTELNTAKSDLNKLRDMIGHPADLPVADIQTAFDANLQTYAPALAKEGTTYLTALQALSLSYKDEVGKNQSLLAQYSSLQSDLNAFLIAKNKLQQDYADDMLLVRAELDKRKSEYDALETRLKGINQGLEDKVGKIEDEKNRIDKDAKDAILLVNTRLASIEGINKNLTSMLAIMDSSIPTYSDANILWVSRDSKMVRINLGSSHGLRPRMSFSVYNADAREISVNAIKGKIEISKVIDGNTAEARVVEDILANPILPGDLIYTPLWSPGQRIHVALSCAMDLDDDGISDPDTVKMLIEMNNAIVDAYIDDLTPESLLRRHQGTDKVNRLIGQIGDDTRYLVIGERPGADAPQSVMNAYIEMNEHAAKIHGLTTISLKDLLTLMGNRSQSQLVGFGPRNRAVNNYEMQPDVANQSSPGRVFEKYENPNADAPTNHLTPLSPLFSQRPASRPTGSASPLFQPRTAPVKTPESK